MPYRATTSAKIRQARPRIGMSGLGAGGLELGRALRDERVALADEGAALLAHVHDDLAPGAEGVGDGADVAHRHRGRPAAVADAEVESGAGAMDRPGHDLPGQLVGLPG